MVGMCRSIMTLRRPGAVPDEDVRAAALQYVRKISGYRAPSEANRATFERAVDDIARSTRVLLDGLVSGRPGPTGQPVGGSQAPHQGPHLLGDGPPAEGRCRRR